MREMPPLEFPPDTIHAEVDVLPLIHWIYNKLQKTVDED